MVCEMMHVRIKVLRRPGWSSQSKYFARLTNLDTQQTFDCHHMHKNEELAARCALRMVDEHVDVTYGLDNI
jgi:hypothetical protein